MSILKRTPSDWRTKFLTNYMMMIENSVTFNTSNHYYNVIEKFLNWLPARKKPSGIEAIDVNSYLKQMKDNGFADTTIALTCSVLKGFFLWMEGERYIQHNPFLKIKRPKFKRTAPFIPTYEEISQMLKKVRSSKFNPLRDSAMLEVLYSTGLRVSELCNLEMKDYQMNKITVRQSKSNTFRTVPVIDIVRKCIDDYLENERPDIASSHLFITESGLTLDRAQVSVMIKNVAKKCNIKGKITPHTLRHACATHLLENGVDLISVQELLGHENITNTQRYIHMSSNRVHSNILNLHPRGKE